ncbi:MAG: S8 family serine peptidase [candidate division Zixibacteria bacterium]|nr:S8 family serine peptidase [candidate division Zixibacteria bacterium]
MSTLFHKFFFVVGLLIFVLIKVPFLFAQPEMSPRLERMLDQKAISDSTVRIIVFLDNKSVHNDVYKLNEQNNIERAARIKAVTRKLQSFRAQGAGAVEFFLKNNSVTEVQKFWIVPAYTATLPVNRLEELARIPGVETIIADVTLEFEEPVEIKNAPALTTSSTTHLKMLKVPSLWSQGYTGKGRLVCSFDTGVESTHPALASKWRGRHAPLSECWYSPVNPNVAPYDNVGHGTHTMGTILGSTATDTFGVAPDAEWITAGVIDVGRDLNTMLSDIIRGYQWALNPDGDTGTTEDVPDVISNSWGVPTGILPACSQIFWQVLDNAEAAGIVTIFAAGNEGPDAGSIRNPADRATTPINSFAVGAVDDNKVIAGFSSRGPSACDLNQIKPEVVAPGVGIYSSTKGGAYKLMSGTSMAAPFISGLVLLCRQYNPNATVEQIKYALIKSAEDLGAAGEDNAYGHGLVDASKLFNYLPVPSSTNFLITGSNISGDGIAVPGENVDLQLTLHNSAANVDRVTGRLVPKDSNVVTIYNDYAAFFFGIGGTIATNYTVFNLTVNSEVRHGEKIHFSLILEKPDIFICDTLAFTLTIGFVPAGSIADIHNSRIDFSVSDFAQFGLGEGSIYNLGREGYRFQNGFNLLYESGIILGRNSLQLSSSVRNSEGAFVPSDFTPVSGITSEYLATEGANCLKARYVDTYSDIPIPVTVSQEIVSYNDGLNDDFLIFKFHLINQTLEKITHLSFGFMNDFDLSAGNDMVVLDENLGMIYQKSASGPLIGLVNLKSITSFKAVDNGTGKIGFNRVEKFDLIATAGNSVDSTLKGDMLFIACSEAFDIKALDSVEVAFALIAGETTEELYMAAVRARQKFDIVTAIEIEESNRPVCFTLNQNYPNPFNPTTNISFDLPTGSEVTLDIYNLLGQKVKDLKTGYLPAGKHLFEWNGTDNNGHQVATGVYFYRLTTSDFSQSRKMMLLK